MTSTLTRTGAITLWAGLCLSAAVGYASSNRVIEAATAIVVIAAAYGVTRGDLLGRLERGDLTELRRVRPLVKVVAAFLVAYVVLIPVTKGHWAYVGTAYCAWTLLLAYLVKRQWATQPTTSDTLSTPPLYRWLRRR